MWCPSVSLSVWANAWLAGQAAPDDVLDALSLWAPTQSVAACDAVTAGSTGLPWPGSRGASAVSLLATVRAAAGEVLTGSGPIRLALPVPGDVRGLPMGTEFARDAVAVGEALVITAADATTAVGLVPDFDGDPGGALSWTVYALSAVPAVDQHDLGDAEYAMRSAVRSAAETLSTVGSQYDGPADPHELVEQLLESTGHHSIPGHAPSRALRVLESAALVDAIITVGAEVVTTGAQSSSQAQLAAAALQPLAPVVRSARAAAVEAILHSAWRG
ncbi:MAG: hypothetical protein ABI253_09715 [Mycobacterium sp.]